MRCSACQTENTPASKFCVECGAQLARTCQECGTELPERARFCPQCGRAVLPPTPGTLREEQPRETYTSRYLAERILDPNVPLMDERKHVTILFADLKGSMEILADRDPEESRKVLDGVLEIMMEAVHRYQGRVTQVMGDGIMALFGAPLAHEDHGLQACCAALAMQEAIVRLSHSLRSAHGVPVQIRVGLNSGEVVVHSLGEETQSGRLGYTAVGRAVHVAARMEQAAAPGSILMTGDTFRLVEGYVDAQPVGPIRLKGLSAPIEAYELLGLGRVRNRLEAATARGLTRFVGREAEMDILNQALEHAGQGKGEIVCAVGEPGVGKSRLLFEFGHSLRTRHWRVLESASTSHGRAPPGAPVIDLLKNYLRLEPPQDEAAIRMQVSKRVLDLDHSLERLVAPLLALLDVPVRDREWNSLDPLHRLRLSLDAFVQLLTRESRCQPLLVILDDLQSEDSVTQTFLDSLVENLPQNRIVLLVSFRPSYQHGWADKSYCRQLRLESLPEDGAGAMLDALVGGDVQLLTLKQNLIARTGGNPFFIEEIVRTLVETGVFGGPRGAYHLEKDPDAIRVPATVEAVLAARIDRLPPDEKRLLQSAAVVGKDVPLAMLRAIGDMDEQELHRGLAGLQDSELLYVGRLRPEPEYTFKHALTHQVAYERLLQERRRTLHGRIVTALESAHPSPGAEAIELLAHHTFRGENWEKAVRYCRQSGVMTAARPAHREAITRFEQALEALKHLPKNRENTELAIDIHFDLRNSLQALGQLERMLGYIKQIQTQATQLGDLGRLGKASSFACQYYRLVGEVGPAIEAGERAIEIARQLNDVQLGVVSSTHLGATWSARGEHRRAAEILTACVEQLKGERARDVLGTTGIMSVFARIYLATTLAELGEFDAAMQHAEPAYQLADSAGHIYSTTFAAYGIGTIRVIRGDIPGSIEILERGLELCRSWNLPVALPLLGASLGHAYCLASRSGDAVDLLEEAEWQGNVMKRMGGQAMLLVRLGEAYLLAGRFGNARRCAQRALELSQRNTERGFEAYALRLFGALSTSYPPALEEAESFYRQAATLAKELEMRPLLAQCHLELGELHCRAGLIADGASSTNAALSIFRVLEMPYWIERAEAQLEQIAAGQNSTSRESALKANS